MLAACLASPGVVEADRVGVLGVAVVAQAEVLGVGRAGVLEAVLVEDPEVDWLGVVGVDRAGVPEADRPAVVVVDLAEVLGVDRVGFQEADQVYPADQQDPGAYLESAASPREDQAKAFPVQPAFRAAGQACPPCSPEYPAASLSAY